MEPFDRDDFAPSLGRVLKNESWVSGGAPLPRMHVITLYSELFPPQKRKVNDVQKIIHFFSFNRSLQLTPKAGAKGQ